MAVLSLKPFKLQSFQTTAPHRDENGEWVVGVEELDTEETCDAISSGRANERQFEDGERKTYTYTIYLDKKCRTYHIGEHVRLISFEDGEPVYSDFTVLGFRRYQTQAKVWV